MIRLLCVQPLPLVGFLITLEAGQEFALPLHAIIDNARWLVHGNFIWPIIREDGGVAPTKNTSLIARGHRGGHLKAAMRVNSIEFLLVTSSLISYGAFRPQANLNRGMLARPCENIAGLAQAGQCLGIALLEFHVNVKPLRIISVLWVR